MRKFALVAAGLLALTAFLASASPALAHPTQTKPCSGCHTQTTAVTLAVTPVSASSTTATYTVTVGNPYGTNGWGVFSGSTKLAGAAGGSATFGVPVGATYTVFGVSGDNNGTEGYNSTTISPAKPALPATPTIAATFATTTGATTVSWTAVSGATSYNYQIGSGSVLSTTSTSVAVSGLAAGTTAFKVQAVSAAGAGGWGTSSIVYTPPAPPAPSVSATYTTVTGSVTISWAAVTGATSYDYQIGSGSVVSTTSTSVTVSALAAGTTAFQVRAVGAGGASGWASCSLVYTPLPNSAPSIATTYTTATGALTVSWPAVGAATSYDYQVAGGSVISTTATSVMLTGLPIGTTAFQVRATNSAGSSAWASAQIVYAPPVPGAPSVPATYTTSTGSVVVSWAAVSGATGYDYQVGSGAIASTTSTSVIVSGLALGTTPVQVRATNSSGASAWATTAVTYSLPISLPSAPSLLATYTTGTGSVAITWPAATGATSYDYQVGSGSVLSTTSTSITVSGLALGTTAFQLRSTNSVGSSGYVSASIVYVAAPAQPSISTTYTTVTGSQVISWPAVSGAASYDYQIGAGSVVSTTSTSVTLSGLGSGTTAFQVRATNSGGSSAWATASVVSIVVPVAPSLDATYSTSTGSVDVTWPAVSGATAYDYQVGSGALTSTTVNTVSISGLALGTTSLQVRARNAAGPSAYAVASIVYQPLPPAAPAISPTFSTITGAVTVSWPAVSGATSYTYEVGGGSPVTTSATSVDLTGLSAGMTQFQVRANNSGGSSAYVTSTLTYVVAPAAPSLDTTYTTNDGSVTIAWPAVAGATSYDYQVGSDAVATTTASSVSLSGLPVGTTAFRLLARNAAGASAYVSASIVYSVPAPGAPQIAATFTTSNGSASVTWGAVNGATGYEYQVASGPVVATTATSVQLTGLSVGTTPFAVRAVGDGGPSAFANASVIYTPPPTVPAAPTLAAKYSSATGTVHVTWPAVSGATSYQYYVTGGSVYTVTTNAIDLAGLVKGTSTLNVCSVNSAGKSAYAHTLVVNAASSTGVSLKLVTLRTAPSRYVTIRATLTGAVPIGKASVRVYVKNPKTGKYKLYAYTAAWTYASPTSQFTVTVRPPKSGRAYAVISADGLKVKSKVFTIRK